MAIITTSDFVGELDIANSSSPNVGARLQWFIDKYELKFLRLLFGDTLYADYKTGLAADPVDDKWTALNALLPELVAAYVYYWYMRDAASKTTGTGESLPQTEGAATTPAYKMQRAWNEMVDGVKGVYDYLDANNGFFTNWQPYMRHYRYDTSGYRTRSYFRPVNTMGL